MADTSANLRAERAFSAFRGGITPALRREVEGALNELVYEYSPTNRENRFVVGGAVERIIAAAMRAAGVPVGNLGHDGLGADVGVYAAHLRDDVLSLKATFQASTTYRLVNFLGTSELRDVHPTMFIQPNVGLVLGHSGHPLIANNISLRDDAIVLPSRCVKEHALKNPEWQIALDVPINPRATASKVASEEVAKAILSRPHYPLLGAMVTSATDEGSERVAMLLALTRSYEQGTLGVGEYRAAKRLLLGEEE